MTWVDVVAWLASLVAVVSGVWVWFGSGPALVVGGVLLALVHWLLTVDEGSR